MRIGELLAMQAHEGDVTKTFKVTANRETMERFEEFLAMVAKATMIGHSSMFGFSVDGDGADRFSVEPKCSVGDGRAVHSSQTYVDHVGPA